MCGDFIFHSALIFSIGNGGLGRGYSYDTPVSYYLLNSNNDGRIWGYEYVVPLVEEPGQVRSDQVTDWRSGGRGAV